MKLMDMSVCCCGMAAEPIHYTRSANLIDVTACLAGDPPRLAGHVPACHRPACQVPLCGAVMRTERYLMHSMPKILTLALAWRDSTAAEAPDDRKAGVSNPGQSAEAARSSHRSIDPPVVPQSSSGASCGRMAHTALGDAATGAPASPGLAPTDSPAAPAVTAGAGREAESPGPAAVVAMLQHVPLDLHVNDVFENVTANVLASLRGMFCAAGTKHSGIFLDESRQTWRVRAGTAESL